MGCLSWRWALSVLHRIAQPVTFASPTPLPFWFFTSPPLPLLPGGVTAEEAVSLCSYKQEAVTSFWWAAGLRTKDGEQLRTVSHSLQFKRRRGNKSNGWDMRSTTEIFLYWNSGTLRNSLKLNLFISSVTLYFINFILPFNHIDHIQISFVAPWPHFVPVCVCVGGEDWSAACEWKWKTISKNQAKSNICFEYFNNIYTLDICVTVYFLRWKGQHEKNNQQQQ